MAEGQAVGRKLKVLLVYYEPQWSGQTTHVLSLARGLDPERHEVTVVLPQELQAAVAAFERTGVQVEPLPMGKVLWRPVVIAGLARLVRGQDVVHVHSQEAGLAGRVVAWLAGARAIAYTPQVIDIRRRRWHWLYRLFERVLARVTDAVVSVNEADRQRLVAWGVPPHKVVTIPNGLDLARFQGAIDAQGIRRTLGLKVGCPLVMQVGRLSAQKDPLAFVAGAAQVVQAFREAQFVLVGDGPLRREVATRIEELGLEGRVHLAGWQPEAFRLMAAADLVTLTSRWEGMPYALLEAMAWSRPVVATAVNGCLEVVVDGVTGSLVPPGDPAAWARAVVKLLKHPDRAAAMGRQGRAQVEAEFTLKGMVGRIRAVYQRVVAQERVGAGKW